MADSCARIRNRLQKQMSGFKFPKSKLKTTRTASPLLILSGARPDRGDSMSGPSAAADT
jgi:hypothetical protein